MELFKLILSELRLLNLQDKLWPSKNPEITWFYLFFPALVGYLVLLTQFINEKPLIGYLESFSPEFDKIFPKGAQIEIISTNSSWSEGPVWIDDDSKGFFLYSDVIQNRIYKWEEGKGFFTVGKTIFSHNAGCYTDTKHCSDVFLPGPNGIIRIPPTTSNPNSLELLICQHGERAISYMRENGTLQILASHYNGKRLNSPNDMTWSPEGDLYFTDPKYGLYLDSKQQKQIQPELPSSGVYIIRSVHIQYSLETGQPASPFVKLLISNLTHPNGIAISPDFSKLYVSNSDPKNVMWMVYDINDETGSLANGRVFFNATNLSEGGLVAGLADGLKVDLHGNVFATGPDGVLVINSEGKLLGRLRLGRAVSNVAFGSDGKLYITSGDAVVRVPINTKAMRMVRKWK